MSAHTIEDLMQMQALPLEAKIGMSRNRIKAWVNEYGEEGVYISFSGGKDSTVLLDLIRNECGYRNIPAVFVDVPTQYPELRDFAKTFDNVEIIRPKISFVEVCEKYGFPLISKEVSKTIWEIRKTAKIKNINPREVNLYDRQFNPNSDHLKKHPSFSLAKWDFIFDSDFAISAECCSEMKKKPCYMYEKKTGRKPIIGTMTEESSLRKSEWLKTGCNAFDVKRPTSKPMSFWTEQDVLKYIKTRDLPICSVYGDIVIDYDKMGELSGQSFLFETGDEPLKTTGCKRTGCMLCAFGCHLNNDNRFVQLKENYPKMYSLLDICKNNGITFREAIEWTKEKGNLDIKL